MEKHIFLDTNVLQQCKLFTEIDWEDLFGVECEKITIHIPNMVLRELDSHKKDSKKARQVIPLLRKLMDTEFKPKIFLELALFPTKWDSLKEEWKKKLDRSDPDHHIIGEILNFKIKYPDKDIWFITGDNLPSLVSEKMQINTIFWRDEKYLKKFQIPKPESKRFPDLFICFEKVKKKINLSEAEPPKLLRYVPPEGSEKINTEDIRSMISALTSPFVKTEEDYKREINTYNEEIERFKNYRKIRLFLINTGKHPFNDIDITINTTLEKGYDIIYSRNLTDLPKPSRNSDFLSITRPMPFNSGPPPNVSYHTIQKKEELKNDIWYFGYHIQRIKHNQPLKLYSIMIKIPDNPKAKLIVFKCSFTHEEEGTIKSQSLVINIDINSTN